MMPPTESRCDLPRTPYVRSSQIPPVLVLVAWEDSSRIHRCGLRLRERTRRRKSRHERDPDQHQTRGLQHQPAIAALGNTHFFVVWTDSSDLTIKGQLIQANGNPSGGEFVVNTPTPTGANTNRQLPTIASSGSGPIVAWIENAVNPPGPRPHVKLQRFNQDGQPSGSEIQVSTTDVDPTHRPAITGMIDGGFLVSWMDARPDQRIRRAQRFSFDGSKKGPEFRVNTTTTGDRFSARAAAIVAPGEGETAFITWADDSRTGGDPSDFAVRGRVLPILASGVVG
jgi:hypothetical protein